MRSATLRLAVISDFCAHPAPELCRNAPMKTPPRLQPLVEEGLIDEVVDRLMSGKEADVWVVRCQGELRCAKVY